MILSELSFQCINIGGFSPFRYASFGLSNNHKKVYPSLSVGYTLMRLFAIRIVPTLYYIICYDTNKKYNIRFYLGIPSIILRFVYMLEKIK